MLFRVKSLIEQFLLVLIAAMLAMMVALMLWQVFTRYVLATPALFTEETLRFMMIWMALLGTAYCFGTRKHLALELVPHMLPPRPRRWLGIFNALITITFATITMFFGGIKASSSAMAQLSPIMQIPIGNAAFRASRSARVYLWRVSRNERVMPNGGIIESTNFTASGP